MGRVVKNARVNAQRYQVSVPQVERPTVGEEAPFYAAHAEEPELLELPSPQSPPIDLDAIWKKLGVSLHGRDVIFDDSAPEAEIRKSMTARR